MAEANERIRKLAHDYSICTVVSDTQHHMIQRYHDEVANDHAFWKKYDKRVVIMDKEFTVDKFDVIAIPRPSFSDFRNFKVKSR